MVKYSCLKEMKLFLHAMLKNPSHYFILKQAYSLTSFSVPDFRKDA